MAFIKGQSGNPAGRKRGSKNRSTLVRESLLDRHAEALTDKAIEMALAGHAGLLKVWVERMHPARRSRGVQIPIPDIKSISDLGDAQEAIIVAMARGEISPEEAEAAARALDAARPALQGRDFENRLKAVEDKVVSLKSREANRATRP